MKKVLLILSIGLAVVLIMQWRDWSQPLPDGDKLPVQESSNSTLRAVDPPTVASLRPPEDYAEIAERPLFVPTRRPFVEEPQEANQDLTEEIADLERLDLSAILILSPDNASVWLKDPARADRSLVRLRRGDLYQGWTVADIKEQQIIMERQGTTQALELLDFSRPKGQSPTAKRPEIQRPRAEGPGRAR